MNHALEMSLLPSKMIQTYATTTLFYQFLLVGGIFKKK
jgi:hypothetical protein